MSTAKVKTPFARAAGFTLAELLISLAILGEIATFTIPKIITAQQNGTYNASAKEAIAMIAGVYQQYQMTNTVSSSTTFGVMTPYINYLSMDTSSTIDDIPGFSSMTCSAGTPCIRLHSGALLRYSTTGSFGGTGASNALLFFYDPDGVYGNSTQGSSKSLRLALYFSGRITSIGQLTSGVSSSNDGISAGFSDPSWFGW